MEIERTLICRPKGSMCMSCVNLESDCSHLNFNEMLPIKIYGDVIEVSCNAYRRKSPKFGAEELELEKVIVAKGLTAPRLTPELIDSKIVKAEYHVFVNSTLTVCCLTLENGFTVTGTSAAASPENFDEEIGRSIAYKNAREKIWELEGYLLRESLHKQSTNH